MTPVPEDFEVAGPPGEPLTLPISTGPATGYDWQLQLPAGVVRVEDGPGREVDPSALLGDAAGGPLRVTAPKGEHTIEARLVRPWNPDDPARVVRIHLHVA